MVLPSVRIGDAGDLPLITGAVPAAECVPGKRMHICPRYATPWTLLDMARSISDECYRRISDVAVGAGGNPDPAHVRVRRAGHRAPGGSGLARWRNSTDSGARSCTRAAPRTCSMSTCDLKTRSWSAGTEIITGKERVMENIIVGLDIGTTKVCAVVAGTDEHGRMNILGVGRAPVGRDHPRSRHAHRPDDELHRRGHRGSAGVLRRARSHRSSSGSRATTSRASRAAASSASAARSTR